MKHIVFIILWTITIMGAATAQKAGLAKLLDSIKADSKANHSTSLLIMHRGKLLVEDYAEKQPTANNIQSITKVVANLAIGKLFTDGQIDSVDIPIYRYYPELNQGQKKRITLRQLLNHTSGLDAQYNPELESISMLQVALCANITDTPGKKCRYNNVAINLLTGIVKKLSGQHFDAYVNEKLFKPIGIEGATWFKDGSGDALAYGGCTLTPRQLLRFGEFAKNKGVWNNQTIIAKTWFDMNMPDSGTNKLFGASGAPYSRLMTWMLYTNDKTETFAFSKKDIEQLRNCGIDNRMVAPFEPLADKPSISSDVFWAAWDMAITQPDDNRTFVTKLQQCGFAFPSIHFEVMGYGHDGGGGQYLYIFPKADLIIVRTVGAENKHLRDGKANWRGLYNWVLKLVEGFGSE